MSLVLCSLIFYCLARGFFPTTCMPDISTLPSHEHRSSISRTLTEMAYLHTETRDQSVYRKYWGVSKPESKSSFPFPLSMSLQVHGECVSWKYYVRISILFCTKINLYFSAFFHKLFAIPSYMTLGKVGNLSDPAFFSVKTWSPNTLWDWESYEMR